MKHETSARVHGFKVAHVPALSFSSASPHLVPMLMTDETRRAYLGAEKLPKTKERASVPAPFWAWLSGYAHNEYCRVAYPAASRNFLFHGMRIRLPRENSTLDTIKHFYFK